MKTQEIWNEFNSQVYFYILKRVKDKNIANDVFQNSFLKIHSNLHQLNDPQKLKAWVFRIVNNEIANHFNQEPQYSSELPADQADDDTSQDVCCFDKFIDELPDIYREAIDSVYLQGRKQKEVATQLNISLANVKARLRRGKVILTTQFRECCQYELNKKGKLVGEPECADCSEF